MQLTYDQIRNIVKIATKSALMCAEEWGFDASPETTDGDGESFSFDLPEIQSACGDDVDEDEAKEVYLGAFWAAFDLDKKTIARAFGSLGGSVKSEAKAAAAKANGKKGGRPRSDKTELLDRLVRLFDSTTGTRADEFAESVANLCEEMGLASSTNTLRIDLVESWEAFVESGGGPSYRKVAKTWFDQLTAE